MRLLDYIILLAKGKHYLNKGSEYVQDGSKYLSKSSKKFYRKNTPVVVINEREYFSWPLFFGGLLVGAIIALLYTPDTGEHNRQKIAEKFNDLTEDKVKFNGRKSYKVREITEDGVKDLQESKTDLI
ncbi:hypothetical protein BH23BAC1_BH23BAC1_08300 [soil metagenome]